ncbi:MAG: hypothetical protein HQL82_14525 [Magnetococcales bacterium]|nr:hypothetical protein [Magnetococcales bacterium]
MTLLFRLDAGREVGYGHLSRCLALARVWAGRGGRSHFLLGTGDPAALDLIREAGCTSACLPEPRAEAAFIPDRPCRAVVVDLNHAHTLADLDDFVERMDFLHRRIAPVVLLDSLGEQGIAHRRVVPAALVVRPYPGVEPLAPGAQSLALTGPTYAVFAPELLAAVVRPRFIRDRARRVLLTFGGSDPSAATLLALAALHHLDDPDLEVEVTLATGFAPDLSRAITSAAATLPRRVTLLRGVRQLAGPMNRCDLALAATGLTKYELALTGTPSIQFSINRSHHAVNRSFAAAGAAWNLGVQADLSPESLAAALAALLADAERRRDLSRRGQELVDGRGAERILDGIMKLSSVAGGGRLPPSESG